MPNTEERILAMATGMAGSIEQARHWYYRKPVPGWAGKTAYELVCEGKVDKVLAYLESVKGGSYA